MQNTEQLGRKPADEEFARRRANARALAKLVIEEEVLPWIIVNSTNGSHSVDVNKRPHERSQNER